MGQMRLREIKSLAQGQITSKRKSKICTRAGLAPEAMDALFYTIIGQWNLLVTSQLLLALPPHSWFLQKKCPPVGQSGLDLISEETNSSFWEGGHGSARRLNGHPPSDDSQFLHLWSQGMVVPLDRPSGKENAPPSFIKYR